MTHAEPQTSPPRRDFAELVQPGRVHHSLYIDRGIFDLEMDRIFGRAWLYVAHESLLKEPGDFVRTRMGRHEVLVTRDASGGIHILRNACAHRGARLCSAERGNTSSFVCPYHAWSFRPDGVLASLPHRKSYPKDFGRGERRIGLEAAPGVASYRGFIFGSWSADTQPLEEFLGPMTDAFDNLIDRAPEGRVEQIGGQFRLAYKGNWKLHHENANDTIHPGFVHESSVTSARNAEEVAFDEAQTKGMMMSNGFSIREWEGVELHGFPRGHSFMGGFYSSGLLAPTTNDPVMAKYRECMDAAYGPERAAEILGMDRFNNLIYPNISVNAQFQQIRVVHPVAPDRTEIHGYCFRLLGAPDEIHRRAVRFLTSLSSPASMIFGDDVEIFERVQRGLADDGVDWINTERGLGADIDDPDYAVDGAERSTSASELPIRTQMQAWLDYMTERPGM